MRVYAVALVAIAAGCGNVDPGMNPPPQNSQLSVTIGGKPASDIRFNLQPVGNGLPATIDITDGKGTFEITPGEYTYFITAGKSDATFRQIPEKYHAGAMDRKFEVKGGEALEFKLD